MTLLPHMFLLPNMYTAHVFLLPHMYTTHVEQFWLIRAVVIRPVIHFWTNCETAQNLFKNRLIQGLTWFEQSSLFLSSARHASSSWHFCVEQIFQAIAIWAVDMFPFCQIHLKNTKTVYWTSCNGCLLTICLQNYIKIIVPLNTFIKYYIGKSFIYQLCAFFGNFLFNSSLILTTCFR